MESHVSPQQGLTLHRCLPSSRSNIEKLQLEEERLNSWTENTIYRFCFHLRVMTEPGVILMYQAQFSLDG